MTNIFAARGAFHRFYPILPLFTTSPPTPRMESIGTMHSNDVHDKCKDPTEPDFSFSGQGHGHVTLKLV